MHRLILAVPLLLQLTACVSPQAAAPTVAHQSVAIDALSHAYTQDLALLRSQTDALITIQRTQTLGSLHRDLLTNNFITPTGAPDPAAFDAALADPANSTTLVLEVRAGRMTNHQAHQFLEDYALLADHSQSRTLRNKALAALLPAHQLDSAAAALRAALATHEQDIEHLFSELSASNNALTTFTSRRALPPSISEKSARAVWLPILNQTIEDPSQREAVIAFVDELLTH